MINTKQPYVWIWVFIAFSAGIAVFGIYKSLSLLKRNVDLAYTVSRLSTELEAVKISLKESRGALGEVYMKNAYLEAELGALQARYAKKDDEVRQYLKRTVSLSSKLRETIEVNNSLVLRSRGEGDRLIRLQLENDELKKKYTTVVGLKSAIRELKLAQAASRRAQAKQRRSLVLAGKKEKPVSGKILVLPKVKEAVEIKIPEAGNQGFFMKDGQSTFQGVVNIEVELKDE